MSITRTSLEHLTQTTEKYQEFQINGKLTLIDNTISGVGKALFSPEKTEEYKVWTHAVFINDKYLIFPTSADCIFFKGSTKIQIEEKKEYFIVTEWVENNKKVLYVDSKKVINKVAYIAYSYMPMIVSHDMALKKTLNLPKDYPNFKIQIAVYNRHGVALFGIDTKKSDFALCWASPSDKNVQMIECSQCERVMGGETAIAKAKDGKVSFNFLNEIDHSLNGDPSIIININK